MTAEWRPWYQVVTGGDLDQGDVLEKGSGVTQLSY